MDPESFVRGGPTLTTFFLVDEYAVCSMHFLLSMDDDNIRQVTYILIMHLTCVIIA